MSSASLPTKVRTGVVAALAALALVAGPALAAEAAPIGVPPGGQSGYVLAWGFDDGGNTVVPGALRGHRVRAVAAGASLSVALGVNGKVYAWGGDKFGDTRVPANLDSHKVTAIAASWYHALALTEDGRVVAWGEDDHGESTVPAALKTKKVVLIAAGHFHSLAVTDDGRVTVWGDGSWGQKAVPAALAGKKVTAIAGGATHSLAATSDGAVYGWGSDTAGESTPPTDRLQGRRVTQVAAGEDDSFALTDDGSVIGWGLDEDGQVSGAPHQGGVGGIAAGSYFGVAVGTGGGLSTWGLDTGGPTPNTLPPAKVYGAAAGAQHGLVVAEPAPGFFADAPPDFVTAGQPYVYGFGASGDPAPTFRVHSGSLPPGLKLSPDGILSGTPTTAGTYTFTVLARGSDPDAVSAEHSIRVLPGPNAHLTLVSGDHQSASTGQPFAEPLVVKVDDGYGNPLQDPRTVTLTIGAASATTGSASFAGGSLTATGTTGADGTFSSPAIVAGDRAGPVGVAVAVAGESLKAGFHLTVQPPGADLRLRLTATPTAKTRHRVGVRVEVADRGPAEAVNVTTVLTLPKDWKLAKPVDGVLSGRQLTFTTDRILKGETLTYFVKLTSAKHRGTATLRATSGSETLDPTLTNNTATATVKVTR